jgi:hypothetical protein
MIIRAMLPKATVKNLQEKIVVVSKNQVFKNAAGPFLEAFTADRVVIRYLGFYDKFNTVSNRKEPVILIEYTMEAMECRLEIPAHACELDEYRRVIALVEDHVGQSIEEFTYGHMGM